MSPQNETNNIPIGEPESEPIPQVEVFSGPETYTEENQISPQGLYTASKKIDLLDEKIKEQKGWIVGGFIALLIMVAVLFFALGAIFIDSISAKQATYLDLRDKVQEQNMRIDLLIKQLNVHEEANSKSDQNIKEIKSAD